MTLTLDGNVDRAMRILYVGNVPLDVAEANLKELLMEYGIILKFRVYRDILSQYALCEYEEIEMAVRAIQSLSNYAIKGQALRVDMAANDRSPEEFSSLQQFVNAEALDVPQPMDVTEKAPEEISKAVASLPAEQMFELMKQMKMCIENNPQEARNLLLQNPQLAYALLQAQVIMRIVDPEVALKILERPESDTLEPEVKNAAHVDVRQTLPAVSMAATTTFHSEGDKDMRQLPMPDFDMRTSAPLGTGDKDMRQVSGDVDLRTMAANGATDARPFDPRFRPVDPRSMPPVDPRSIQPVDPRSMQQTVDPRGIQPVDPRSIQPVDPRSMQPSVDPRSMQPVDPRSMQPVDPRAMQRPDPRVADPRAMKDADLRVMPGDFQGVDPRMIQGGDMSRMDPRMMPGSDPRTAMAGMNPRPGPGVDPRALASQQGPGFGQRPGDPRGVYDPRSMARVEDPRKAQSMRPPVGVPPPIDPNIPEDEEKAALIMQVLQLSEEQIAMLPPEQRQSIMVLKEQIARSQLL
ncbi:hypothetical protein JTE90_016112 [Oedothorax gibbosus]|uniref:RRM domain-containing protein n=1 Tax=Oedothorax gibbosus TaxID=931172 RepID=A0AAV6U2L5_9ARAC|nr:hypothetical protein JTE90_016112 [Oedothorax gibbosus]